MTHQLPSLTITNHDELSEQMEDAALAESLAARLAVRGEARCVPQEEAAGLSEEATWLLLSGTVSTGVAIDTVYPTRTVLSANLALSRCASLIGNAISTGEWPPGEWDPSEKIDSSWRRLAVGTALGDLHVALRGDTSQLPPYALPGVRKVLPRVTMPVRLRFPWEGRVKRSTRRFLGHRVECLVDGQGGYLSVGGVVGMELQLVRTDNDRANDGRDVQDERVGIVVELGTLELTIGELCRLRRGMKITAKTPDSLRCVFKVGSTKVGMANLEFDGEKGISMVVRELF